MGRISKSYNLDSDDYHILISNGLLINPYDSNNYCYDIYALDKYLDKKILESTDKKVIKKFQNAKENTMRTYINNLKTKKIDMFVQYMLIDLLKKSKYREINRELKHNDDIRKIINEYVKSSQATFKSVAEKMLEVGKNIVDKQLFYDNLCELVYDFITNSICSKDHLAYIYNGTSKKKATSKELNIFEKIANILKESVEVNSYENYYREKILFVDINKYIGYDFDPSIITKELIQRSGIYSEITEKIRKSNMSNYIDHIYSISNKFNDNTTTKYLGILFGSCQRNKDDWNYTNNIYREIRPTQQIKYCHINTDVVHQKYLLFLSELK